MGVESVAFTAPRPAGPSANIAQWRREKGGKKMRRHFCKASYRVPAAPKRAAPAALPYGLKKRPETVPRCLLLKRPFTTSHFARDPWGRLEPARRSPTRRAGGTAR